MIRRTVCSDSEGGQPCVKVRANSFLALNRRNVNKWNKNEGGGGISHEVNYNMHSFVHLCFHKLDIHFIVMFRLLCNTKMMTLKISQEQKQKHKFVVFAGYQGLLNWGLVCYESLGYNYHSPSGCHNYNQQHDRRLWTEMQELLINISITYCYVRHAQSITGTDQLLSGTVWKARQCKKACLEYGVFGTGNSLLQTTCSRQWNSSLIMVWSFICHLRSSSQKLIQTFIFTQFSSLGIQWNMNYKSNHC